MMVETGRKYLGRWDVAVAAESGGAQHIYGPQDDPKIPRQIRYQITAPIHCRVIWLKFSLSASAQTVPDLFSFDERPTTSAMGLPCLHAKRIMVLGKQAVEDEDINYTASMSEKLALRNMLEASARWSRLRVRGLYPTSLRN
jgi:hypothetical protein